MISSVGLSITRLGGYAPALPTPFDEHDKIDLAAFERICVLQLRAGATALVVAGTTGEAPTLSHTEHAELVALAADVASGRIPVIAGTGSNSTARAIALTQDAEAAGADAALSVVPYYNKPTQAGIYAHSPKRQACRSFSTMSRPERYPGLKTRPLCGWWPRCRRSSV